jgi:P-type Ca2+ transporter type 2C
MRVMQQPSAQPARKVSAPLDGVLPKRASVEIVHSAVPGRVRFRHRGLMARPPLARKTETALRGTVGVTSAHANPLTGSVLITYDAPASCRRLAEIIEDVVASRIPGEADGAPPPRGLSSAAAPALVPSIPRQWHALTRSMISEQLATDTETGLVAEEAKRRLFTHGRNELIRLEPRSMAALLAEQMTSLPITLLGGSAVLSLATGGIADAVIIAAVVLLNAGIATATERQAEHTILGLSRYTPSPVPVVRGGRRDLVQPSELVPGDRILLERGTLIPADARLVSCDDLSINEAALTGEALPVQKDADVVLPDNTELAERHNMVFRGTVVTGGSGAALVTATGMVTEIGRVQHLLGAVSAPETPMQRQLGDVGRELIIVNGLICGAILGLGLLRGHPLIPLVRSAISLGVAAIPEGLPAVATTTLALGIQDMRKRNILVRKLDAVETLGAVEVVGLDKTGTLTENRMTTVAIHADGAALTFEAGRLMAGDALAPDATETVVRRLFEVAALSSDAIVREVEHGFAIEGTPTESALIETAITLDVDVPALRLDARVLATALRSDRRKRMSTLHATTRGRLLCVKGDPVEVLERCTHHRTGDGLVPLDEETRGRILKANERMASQALRVLGIAVNESGGTPYDERDLVWLGLAGLANPIRPSVAPALDKLHRAGVRAVMFTGDQSPTAFAIARNLDLAGGDELKVLEAGQIANMRPDLLAALVGQPQVFARVNPVDKLNIVRALQSGGHIVAMTGDGINDGPALKAADIGIAMGGEGTDVAREVADIVLAGDDLDGIIEAIRLGRATYANIRKVLRYLVSTNAGETFTMLGAALVTGGEALTPMQLLWLNLVSDPLPALALGLEPPEAGVLDQPPHDPRAPILSPRDFRHILREGTVMGGAALTGYFLAGGASNPVRAGTLAFHGLTFAQLLHALSCRSETHGFAAEIGRPPSAKLYATLAGSAAVQVAAQMFPLTRRFLRLAPLGVGDVLAIAGIAVGSTLANDLLGRVLRDFERPLPRKA